MLADSRIFRFRFAELGVKPGDIEILLGFGAGLAHEPFPQYIKEVLDIARGIENICGSYILSDTVSFDLGNNITTINQMFFKTEKVVTRQLWQAEMIAIFICTAGKELEEFSKQQMKSGNIPEGYIADMAGSLIVEAAMDKIQAKLASEMDKKGYGITNRYSPGYCGWKVEEQQKLFQLMPKGLCNISLGESSLMQPIKSVSGVIGIGTGVKNNPYTCSLCNMKNCMYSKFRKTKEEQIITSQMNIL